MFREIFRMSMLNQQLSHNIGMHCCFLVCVGVLCHCKKLRSCRDSHSFYLFELWLNAPVNSYGHVGTLPPF